jgi:hypothetical protein
MVGEATQSPEADLDREIEKLIGAMVRGTLSPGERVRLGELQNERARLLRPSPPSPPRRGPNFYHRKFA